MEESTDNNKPSKKPTNHVHKITKEIIEGSAILFRDQRGDAYIAPMGNGATILRLRSKGFRWWLSYFGKQMLKKPLTNNVITDVIQDLEGEARYQGKTIDLSVRVARLFNSFFYDLGQEVIHIESGSWHVCYQPPILFQRFNHQKRQVTPETGGSLDLLDDILPYSMTEEQRLLFKISLITGLVPDIPQTVDVIYGDHGSAKSSLMKVKKSLLDPSLLEELTPPNSIGEMIQLLAHHWYVPLGNLTRMPQWMSDMISRASTGAGFSKRELYTDNDDVIYQFYRIVGLNGINLIAEQANLLDRALLIGDLERIPPDKRIQENTFWNTFEERKPLILGALFETLAKATEVEPTIELTQTPRMADFTRWGCAVAEALGRGQSQFLATYQVNIRQQHEEAIEASPVGATILKFMVDRDSWEGTPSELLSVLYPIAEEMRVVNYSGFPKNARWVTRRVKEVRVNLKERGTLCEFVRSEQRVIRISKVEKNNVDDDNDDETEVAQQLDPRRHRHQRHQNADIERDSSWARVVVNKF